MKCATPGCGRLQSQHYAIATRDPDALYCRKTGDATFTDPIHCARCQNKAPLCHWCAICPTCHPKYGTAHTASFPAEEAGETWCADCNPPHLLSEPHTSLPGSDRWAPVTDEERLAAARDAIGHELPERHLVTWVTINHVKLVLDALVRATRRERTR